jgi:predicted short-subunit dehydrogenase-like oxidoreductase (DUF2520 family)
VKRLALTEADAAAMSRSELCLLTVPDAAVGPVARAVAPELGRTTGLVHCAGALTLELLQPAAAGRPTGSFHPLVSVTGPETPLGGYSAAIATRSRVLAPLLGRLAEVLGLRPLRVPEQGRAAYHAGAALAASGLVSLLDAAVAAWREAGVPERDALAALVPLMRSALDGAEARGTVAALTGPVSRGDAEVVQAHVRALPPDVLPIYLALQQRVLAHAAARLPTRWWRASVRCSAPRRQSGVQHGSAHLADCEPHPSPGGRQERRSGHDGAGDPRGRVLSQKHLQLVRPRAAPPAAGRPVRCARRRASDCVRRAPIPSAAQRLRLEAHPAPRSSRDGLVSPGASREQERTLRLRCGRAARPTVRNGSRSAFQEQVRPR